MVDVTAKVAPNAVDPTIRFTFSLTYQHRYVVPLFIEGEVRAEDSRVLGTLVATAEPPNTPKFGILPRSSQNEPQQTLSTTYDCRLSTRAVEYLVNVRDRNPRKDVILHLGLKTWSLYPRFALSDSQHNTLPQGVVMADQTTWGLGLGEVGAELSNASVTIFSSQWTTDYAPAFGIGRFLIFDLPDPAELALKTASLGPRLLAAVTALGEMRSDIQAGEWSECVEHSRGVAELVKNPQEVAEILKADGLSTMAADDLLKAIRGAFDFASKFLKKVERGSGEVNPDLVAKKEDAYYVYSNSLTLVNLLSRKAARHPDLSRSTVAGPPSKTS